MQSAYPPRPPYPPRPGSTPGESDRNLIAHLTGSPEARHHATALLLARHWRATCDYAIVCLASATPAAQLVASAAFERVLGRLSGGAVGGALRPQLLVAVRETVRAWAADEAISVVVPELRKTTGGRGLSAARPGTPERRQLAERAFRALPGASQCLLWHTEVEAEPINIPAGLLGVDTGTATAALEQAREQFRTGLVRAHRELAPSKECRFYNRLLDVPIRRGGSLLPDVQRHLAECRYCRQAVEQLSHFDGGLEVLLAETVLGWGARRYLDSRPGRGEVVEAWPADGEPVRAAASGGRHRFASVGGRRKALVAGVGLVSLVLLATVLVVRSWSDDSGVPHPGATTWGAPSGSHTRPGPGEKPSAASPSPASVGEPVELAHGRLRSLDAGLCVDVRGDRVRAGAELRLGPCSDAGSQQWSYQDDGMLRSALDPTLCLAADPGARSVVVSGCLVHAGEVSYDLTVAGELLLRWDKGLALSADGTKVVVAGRDGSVRQRWALDTGSGAAAAPAAGPSASPEPKEAERTESPRPSRQAVPDQEFGKPQDPSYGTRVAQVGSRDRPVPVAPPGLPGPAEPVGALVEAAGPVLDSVPDVVSEVATLPGRPSPVGEDGATRGGRTS
ncbi:ricin-type beta-trefoil lectin protein [Streptomyces sp. Ag109_O5-1]|uniref:RICIN domain-containing protein n=1 Tax=Streptomyces sp. Ag109_O5-1 TaxID=1938851 RepID=UPI000F91ECE7|nr:RICIN domain-containing protein [Streptomyces sp. Ag109_O5-1]RPE45605.1 ricin-type beta-trefoil lectin protein [Streptomyces sp. Ag109_O5-1]